MCPDFDRPIPGLFNQERALCAGSQFPQFAIDTAAGALLAANAAGWRAWGLDAALAPLPLALDGAMPALRRLREVLHTGLAVAAEGETLTFWTARGLMRLVCGIEAQAQDGSIVCVKALEGFAIAPPRATDPTPQPGISSPQVALDAWLAHELRTPLSAVIAYAEILKDEHFGPLASARYKGYARDIYESARHALGVVDSLLQADPTRSRVPPLALAELEPARVVDSCLTVVRPLAERAGLVLTAELAPQLPRVLADELSLKQMLLNLLANAIKFGRPGDRVTIAVARDSAGLHMCVADTGPGMGAEGSCAPCANTSSPGGVRRDGAGLGLGLPLTRALAAANGAHLRLESAPGEGTRAIISFGEDRVVCVR
jgi:two-component system, cell cycle sensor histidine kinase PleC